MNAITGFQWKNTLGQLAKHLCLAEHILGITFLEHFQLYKNFTMKRLALNPVVHIYYVNFHSISVPPPN
jgi:hypothetical protein